jgi:hypothetical protein
MLKSNRRPQHLDTIARWFMIPMNTPPTLITTATTDKIELVVVESILLRHCIMPTPYIRQVEIPHLYDPMQFQEKNHY